MLTSLFATLFCLSASANSPVTGSQIAEYVFFQNINTVNLSDAVEKSELSLEKKSEIQTYLKLHHLEKKSIDLKWNEGSSRIVLQRGSTLTNLDFSQLPEKQIVKANGVDVEASNIKYFSDLVQKFESAELKKTALIDFIFPAANAKSTDPSHSVYDSIMYWSGLDQVIACKLGEEITRSHCVLKKNSSMILASVGKYGSVSELTCNAKGFTSVSLSYKSGNYKLSARHNQAGQLSNLTSYYNGSASCDYALKSGKLLSIKNYTQAPNLCDGRSTTEYMGMSHELKAGAEPRFVASFPISIQRLEKCCTDSKCRTEINSAIKTSSSSKSSNHSVQ